jgi:hypothetical protein
MVMIEKDKNYGVTTEKTVGYRIPEKEAKYGDIVFKLHSTSYNAYAPYDSLEISVTWQPNLRDIDEFTKAFREFANEHLLEAMRLAVIKE